MAPFLPKNQTIFFTLGAFALFLLGRPIQESFALTSNDLANGLVSGGSIWLETTLIVALAHISVVAFSLQIARSYFISMQSKLSLKLGSDISWLIYVLARDGLLILSFVIGLLVFLPATFLDYPMAVPFMPVADVLFGAALVTKLYTDSDDNRKAFRLVTVLVFSGTMLWVLGTIFVTESPLFLSTLPSGVSQTGGMWYYFLQRFSSQSNLTLTMETFETCFVFLAIMGVLGLFHSILHWTPRPRNPIVRVKYSESPLAPISNVFAKEEELASNNTPMKSRSDLNSPRTLRFSKEPPNFRPDYIN
jgi:hypothetical protein